MGINKYETLENLEFLRSWLLYDKEASTFSWARNGQGKWVRIGNKAGGFCGGGYWRISVKNQSHYAHRLAWAFYYGAWPESILDHIDGIKHNNRIENLRLADLSENLINQKLSSRNTTGAKGVCAEKNGTFSVYFKARGKNQVSKGWKTIDEAAHKYNKWAIAAFGDFAVLNPIGEDYVL
ncbi:HNH endonuclease [Pseudomonas sp.]|uniref:HNH endonuclease n=1 Tax=Pseudomonas sp. TaxID=306 RepID=UPI003FD7D01F